PGGIYPSVALQCQFILLLALAKEHEIACRLAEKLAPIVTGGFWTLWSVEKEYLEEETKISCALFLRAIGQSPEFDFPHLLTPFFSYLCHAAIEIPIDASLEPLKQIAWTIEGSQSSLGAIRLDPIEVLAFGPHAFPLNNPQRFGIAEGGA